MKRLYAALISLVVGASFAPPATAASLKDRLPEDAYGYMAVNDLPDFLEKVRATRLYQGLVELDFIQTGLTAPQLAEVREARSTYIAPLGKVFCGEVVVAVLPAEAGDYEPRVIAAAEVDEAAYGAYFESAIEPLLDSAGIELEEVEAGSLSMLRITPYPEADDDVMVLAVEDGVFTMAESAEVVAAFVLGPGRARLGRTEGYTAFRRVAGQCDVELYADIGRIMDDALGDEDPEQAAVIERLGLGHLLWAGLATWIRDDGSLSVFRVESASPPGGILGALQPTGAPLRSAHLVPSDAHLYFAINVTSFADLYEGFIETIGAARDLSRAEVEAELGVDQLGLALGLDLREEILPAFGGELAIAVKAPAQPFARHMPAAALFIEVKDRAVMQRLMAKLVEILTALAPEGTEPVRTAYKGADVVSLALHPGIAPAYAFTERFLVVGISESVVRRILDTAPSESLRESDGFRALLEEVEGGGAVTVYGECIGLCKALISVGSALAPGETASADMMNLLALGDDVAVHFVWAFSVNGRGITARSYSELGPFNPVTAILAVMTLPAIAGAREEARTAGSMSNAKQIALAVLQYSNAHDGMLPEKLSDLVKEGILPCDLELFVHPRGTDPELIDFDKPETVDEYSDYELMLKGVNVDTIEDPARAVLLREKRQFREGGRVVVYLDGHVDFVEEEPEGEEE